MGKCDATTAARAALRAVRAPLSAGLVTLACGITTPANAVMIVVDDSGSTYSLLLQVGTAGATVDTVQFNVTGNNVGLTPTAVAGSPAIDITVKPMRPANASTLGTARPVTLRVDSSTALSCQGGGCGSTSIPFSKISWTATNNVGTGDIQNGQFNGTASQQIASFNAYATVCALGVLVCLLWDYQSNVLSATRLTFSYANDTIYPAGTYRGTVKFTASME